MLSPRFFKAIAYAGEAHKSQTRKNTDIPYISHLIGVASIVLEADGTETEAIAALLHDVVEDQPMSPGGGEQRLQNVVYEFDQSIGDMVASLSDWISKSSSEKKDALPYDERKRKYQEHLRHESNSSVLLVSAADKLHNARAMETDHAMVGEALWGRFSGSKEAILANFLVLISIYQASADARVRRVAGELARTVERLGRTNVTVP